MLRIPPGGIMCIGCIAPAREGRVGKGEEEAPVSAEEEKKNEALVRWWWEEVWVKGNVAAVDDFVAPQLRRSSRPSWATTWPRGHEASAHHLPHRLPRREGHPRRHLRRRRQGGAPLERSRHPPGRVVGRPPDRTALYDERDLHLPHRRGQGGGRLEQRRGEPHGGRTAVVERRRR
jgi:hypothetical protein